MTRNEQIKAWKGSIFLTFFGLGAYDQESGNCSPLPLKTLAAKARTDGVLDYDESSWRKFRLTVRRVCDSYGYGEYALRPPNGSGSFDRGDGNPVLHELDPQYRPA